MKISVDKKTVLNSEKPYNLLCCEGWVKRLLKGSVFSLALPFCLFSLPALADTVPVPTLGENSAYTLTKVDQAGENTITKYEWSDSENKYVPVYYRVDLNKTEYGNPKGDTTLTLGWEKNADTGNLDFKQDPMSPVGQTITYKYNTSDALTRIDNTADKSSETISGAFIGQNKKGNGGAIANNATYASDGKLGDINADFVNNYALSEHYDNKALGGAISNYFKLNNKTTQIGNINGDFIGNHATLYDPQKPNSYSSLTFVGGGAISAYIYDDNVSALANNIIGNITGDFIGNYAISSNSGTYGGAISLYVDHRYSDDKTISSLSVGNISGNFIGNYAVSNATSSYSSYANGGAIFVRCDSFEDVSLSVGNITGDFIGNYAAAPNSATGTANGGAIYINSSHSFKVGNDITISGDFIKNYVAAQGNVSGGAVYLDYAEDISLLNSSFYDNYALTQNGIAKGGAIYNKKQLSIIADNGESIFSGNYVKDKDGIRQEAIYNDGQISLIAKNKGVVKFEDMINGNGSLLLTGDNTGTISLHNDVSQQEIRIENVTVDLQNNKVNNYNFYGLKSDANSKYNFDLDMTNKTADKFTTKNYADGIITINILNFIGSETDPSKATTFQLIKNSKYSNLQLVLGNNIKFIGSLDPNTPIVDNVIDYIPNVVNNNDIFVQDDGISLGTTDTYHDSVVIQKDKIYDNVLELLSRKNSSKDRTFQFVDNSTYIVKEDIGKTTEGTLNITGLGSKTPSTIDANGHSLFEIADNTKLNISNTTIKNAKSQDGSVINAIFSFYSDKMINLENTSLKNNMSSNKGGAIYTNQGINITAKNGGNSVFTGNYTESDGVKTPNAIYVEGAKDTGKQNINVSLLGSDKVIVTDSTATAFPTITLNANTNGTIQFDDQIQGSDGTFEATIKSGTMAISDKLKPQLPDIGLNENATVSELIAKMREMQPDMQQYTDEQIVTMFLQQGLIVVKDEQIISSSPLGSYDLKITGDKTGKVILNNDVINANISLDNTNLYLGRDNVFDQSQSLTLNSGSMSMINNQAGTMNIPTLNLNGTTNLGVDVDLANKQMDTIKATNYNVAEGGKLNVNNINLLNDAKEDLTNIQFTDNKDLASATAYTGVSPIAYSPIYKYEVAYNPDEGFFTFTRGGGSGNQSDNFNPAVLAPSVATQAGAYTTQLQTFNYAFQHADTFMNIPYMERTAMINQNKYALSPTGDATDVGTFSPLLIKEQDAGFWVKPYASFENIPLNNGPKVSNINYGTLVGYDSSLTPIAKGWERVLTGYIGYNGASQRYSGVDAYQNGGILGGTATLYKGNFFNATTLSVGATAGDASTMYGNENYAMLLAGVGNKTGYNFEFKDGRIILQPNFLISYTFVNTFDYTNGAGVRIKSDPLNAIQLAPGLKLIGNTKTGWQPYLSVAMVWNLLDDSKVTANDVRLPEMSIDPYVQYGAGIQKRFKDRFIAFGQAMIHNGGRNGVSLTGGIRWSVGK